MVMLRGNKSENSRIGSCDLIHLTLLVSTDGALASRDEDVGKVDGG
jgi:hypothetical protein